MNDYLQEEINNAVKIICSLIDKCEKIQKKFSEGTSQHSLLKNRIKALYILKYLLINDETINSYTDLDLKKAVPPILSIQSKTEKAQRKYEEGSTQYKRFTSLIRAMTISNSLIETEILKRS
ncbi:hypothetical protein [Clostridium butyricum]|uniref:hypothetical protein n=1 Tax=Clostridium butyricum TaxID=1492 RepID=UPI00374FCB16